MERIISELKNTADKVAKKSGELMEISKIKLSIATTKSEINAQFKSLGEMVYHAQKETEDSGTQKIEELIEKLDVLHERLDQLMKMNSSLKNEQICPFCGKSNLKEQAFCGSCGNKLDQDEDETVFEGEVIEDIPDVETI